MSAWCLPKQLAGDFLNALRDGTLDPEKLMAMSSAERQAAFAAHVGPDFAAEVNAQFEAKLLLKDQQKGLVNWARKVGGLTDPARRDIISTIGRMEKVLQPADESGFLADLAAKKLGTTVTADEAKGIFELTQAAQVAKATMLEDISNEGNRVAYGRALMAVADRIDSLKPNGQTFTHNLINILNIPKSALTSIFHFSAPFVQGWGMLSTKVAWQGFGKMFQYFSSEEAYKNLNAYMISHPDYELAKSGKLGLTLLGEKLSSREEAIQSTLVEQANEWLHDRTGVPNLVRMSSRAFTGYLNFVRFNRFTDLLNAARLRGEDVRPGTQVVNDLAKVVNDFTGRGELGPGDKYAAAGPALNSLFFSPRKIVATMEMFNPVRMLDPRVSPTARAAAFRQLSGSLVATGAVLALAKAMGANVNFDPRSADFAKIDIGGKPQTVVDPNGKKRTFVVGGEKLDLTGGNDAYVRLLARIATNQEVTAQGKLTDLGQGFRATTRAELVGNYMRNKLSPIAGFIADALYGTDPTGRPFSVTKEMQDKLIPISIGAFLDFGMNNPTDSAAIIPSLAAVFGVQLETPLPPMAKAGRDVWGDHIEPFGTPPSWHNDPVNQEFERLGYTPSFPMDQIRGVKLTAPQYDDYMRLSGRLAHVRLGDLVQSSGWDSLPGNVRLSVMKDVVKKSRDMAATSIMLQSQGSTNDIMKQATEAKMATLAPVQ